MSDEIPSAALALELSLAMSRLRARLRTEQASVTSGQTMSQLSVLGRVAEAGSITAAALTELEHVRQQSMSETVASLMRQGLLRGDPDPNDGRKRLLRLTPKGQRLVDSIVEFRGSWLALVIDRETTTEDRAVLIRAARILSRFADTRDEATARTK